MLYIYIYINNNTEIYVVVKMNDIRLTINNYYYY